MSMQLQRFSGLISDEQRAHVEWVVELSKDDLVMKLLFGYCLTIAVEHQDWSWWQVLEEARRRFIVKRQPVGKTA